MKKGSSRPQRLQRNPRVPRPLEAVCLKAMALKPSDRYADARALADDVEHWLADEPVSVYREPWTERAARWAKRHKAPVAAAATWPAGRFARGRLDRSRGGSSTSSGNGPRPTTGSPPTPSTTCLTRVGAVELVDVPQMETVRRQLLDRALAYYNKFLKDKRNDPTTRFETSRAHVRLADIDELLGQYPRG